MKKILIVLAAVLACQTQAREMMLMDEEKSLTPSGLCSEYNQTAIDNLYTFFETNGLADVRMAEAALQIHNEANRQCNEIYNRYSEKGERALTQLEMKNIEAQCDMKNILTPDRITHLSDRKKAYLYIKSFKTRSNFTSAHMTNLTMSCEVAKKSIDKLKATLNL